MSKERRIIVGIILAIIIVVTALVFLDKVLEKRRTDAIVADIIEKEKQIVVNGENLQSDNGNIVTNDIGRGIPIEEPQGTPLENNINALEIDN